MRLEIRTEELESKLYQKFQEILIPLEDQIILKTMIGKLKKHHLPSYEHSIRVALKSLEVAKFIQGWIEPRIIFYPSLLHDIGKEKIRVELLDKTKGWTLKDSYEIEPHTENGAKMVEDIYEFSALVIRNSHKLFKETKNRLERNHDFSERTNLLAWECARLLNIIDSYDAATYRKNDRNSPGNPRYLNPEEVKKVLLRENKDRAMLIEGLYSAGIL